MHPDQAGYLRAPLAAPAHSPFLEEPDWAEEPNSNETDLDEIEP
jgi:hypothetical protein